MELTEVQFWDEYWAKVKLPVTIDDGFSWDRCLAKTLRDNVPSSGGEVLEVGCAPGKWLAFMARQFGLVPSGVEYSDAGMNATLNNFRLLGLKTGEIRAGDFFNMKPTQRFDIVMSFGFIEHFTDVDEVVALHLEWLKPGGTLILGVPNFRGVNYALQKVLDNELLEKHNLDIMNLDYFHHLAKRFDLRPIFLDYIGSFEPALPISKPGVKNLSQFVAKSIIKVAHSVRKLKAFDTLNSSLFSSYIVGIYTKRG